MFKGIRRRFMPSCKDCKWFKYLPTLIRKRLIPPCSKCKWFGYSNVKSRPWVCRCPKILRHEEKILGRKVYRVDCCAFIGTRHCKFEPEYVKEEEQCSKVFVEDSCRRVKTASGVCSKTNLDVDGDAIVPK